MQVKLKRCDLVGLLRLLQISLLGVILKKCTLVGLLQQVHDLTTDSIDLIASSTKSEAQEQVFVFTKPVVTMPVFTISCP